MTLKTKNSEINIRKLAGEVIISIQQHGSTIKIHKELLLNHSLIPAVEYDGYRQFITTWNNSNNSLIFRL